MNDTDLESILRKAPQPSVPAGLRERLKRQIHLPGASGNGGRPRVEGSWLERWWPTLLVGGGVVACAATLLTQQGAIRELIAQREATRAEAAARVADLTPPADAASLQPGAMEDEKRSEILRLRAELAALRSESAAAESLIADNRQLEGQIAAEAGLSPEDLAALDHARDRAKSIQCINHMKNLGLALRIWATDHPDLFPTDLLMMTNELGSPKILVCPADTRYPPAGNWASFGPGQISYEFLAPGGSETDVQRVAARCPIHRHILLSDGSVQMSQGDGTYLTQHLVTRDGKLYMD